MARKRTKFEYDVALSFAGEDRAPAEKLYALLERGEVSVFYDSAEQDKLWGKDLYQHLQDIYRDRARFCVVFVSRHYAKKRWTRHELRQAQERAFQENTEYILPVRIDGTKVPGLNMTTGYLDLRVVDVELVAGLLLSKLGKMSLSEIDPDKLYWNGRFVTYRGQRVASYWPKRIRQSQRLTTVQLTFDRIKYGSESNRWRSIPCHDCGALKGEYHVPGCDVEECPSCHTQLISCGCLVEC